MDDDPAGYRQILAGLRHLSQAELARVRMQAGWFIEHSRNTRAEAPVSDEDWLFVGIVLELQRRGQASRTDFRFKKPQSFGSFQSQSDRVRALLTQLAPELTAVEHRKLGQIAGYELASYIGRWTTVNLENMLRNVGRVPEAIDAAYPGYMASGLLEVLVRT